MNGISVSTIIPVFNAAAYVTEAVESVFAQRFKDQEIILINDGSTDQSLKIISSFTRPGVRVESRINRGPAVTLNEGIKSSEGEFLAFLDADDCWLPYKLDLQINAFDADPELDCCFGHVKQFISPELPMDVQNSLLCPEEPQPGLLRQTMLVRKEAFLRVGYFDESLRTGEFIDWYLRAKFAGLKMLMLSEVVTERRLHRQSMGSVHDHDRQFAGIMKNHLDRIRKNR